MKKILAVIRVSTTRQETESQKKELVNFILSKGKFKEEEIDFIEVAGASAIKMNAKYRQMLQSIKDKILQSDSIRTVAFWHLNRLGRNEKAIVDMKSWFKENNIQVWVQTPSLTLLKDNGEIDEGANISWSVFAALAESDAKELKVKMARGKRFNAEKGKFIGGKTRLGYAVDEDKNYVINPKEASIVRLCYELYLTGKYSYTTLLKELETRNFHLSENVLRKILSDEAYTGKQKESGMKLPPIVEEEDFNKVQEIREKNLTVLPKESKNKKLALKILKCSICGSNFFSNGDYYYCYRSLKRKFGEERCKMSVGIKREQIEQHLLSIAKRLHVIMSTKNNEQRKDELQKQLEEYNQKITAIEPRIEKINAQLERAKELYIRGDITKSDYNKRKEEISSKINAINAEKELYEHTAERIERQIKVIFNENVYYRLALPLEDFKDEAKAYELVHTYIESATVNKETYNEKKVLHIIITDIYGNIYDFFDERRSGKTIDALFNLHHTEFFS